MDAPKILSSEIVCELPRGERNPRNSEGDFAVLRDGRILFAYCRYGGDSAHDDAACDIAGLVSCDGGKSFAPLEGKLVKAEWHGVQNVMSVSLVRLVDGTLCIVYLAKHGPQSAVYLRRAVGDETAFGEAECCVPVKRGMYYVINNSRVMLDEKGRVLVPVACHKIVTHPDGRRAGEYYGKARVFAYDPVSRTTEQLGGEMKLMDDAYSRTGLQEPGVARLADGRLYGYFRTDRMFQYESFFDGAKWSRPRVSRFTSPDSPLLIRRNPYSGRFYALWNPVPNYNGRLDPDAKWIHAGRTPFVLAQSEDGLNFSPYAVLEDAPDHGYCYPAMLFLSEREMLISYCCGGPEDDMCLTRTAIRRVGME